MERYRLNARQLQRANSSPVCLVLGEVKHTERENVSAHLPQCNCLTSSRFCPVCISQSSNNWHLHIHEKVVFKGSFLRGNAHTQIKLYHFLFYVCLRQKAANILRRLFPEIVCILDKCCY